MIARGDCHFCFHQTVANYRCGGGVELRPLAPTVPIEWVRGAILSRSHSFPFRRAYYAASQRRKASAVKKLRLKNARDAQ